MTIETQIREMLYTKADDFDLPLPMPTSVAEQARRRARRITGAMAAVTLVVAGALTAVVAAREDERPRRFASVTIAATADPPSPDHAHDDPGREITEEDLRTNIDCMRDHGFQLPDPVITEDGWSVLLDEIPPDTDAWRQAVFVDCRLMDAGTELVLGGRTRAEIDALVACARDHGHPLPAPTNHGDTWEFPLDPTTPPSDDWYRTVFVTCSP